MLAEYATEYKDAIPFCRNAGAIYGTQMWGASGWDTLLFCNNQGISPGAFAQAWMYPLSDTPMTTQQVYGYIGTWAKIFTCPSATVPLNMGSSINTVLTADPIDVFTTYDCNPNFFMDCYPPGAQSGAPAVWVNSNPLQDFTITMSNVANPGQKIAIADGSQLWQNGGVVAWPILAWWQNAYPSLQTASPEDMVSSQGFTPGWNMNTDYPSLGYPWQLGATGMRFRHGQTNASDNGGWANAVFFDGHAASVVTNQLPAGSPGIPPISGTTGLRVINIVNPTLSPNAMQ
jgi:prepilin-type processing-associated H-X9-DG protein